MTLQSFLKHLLTEGDKLLLSWLSPLEDQAGYAVAVNYGPPYLKLNLGVCQSLYTGSLVARIIFQPIEESLRLLFSKIPIDSMIPSGNPIHAGQSNRRVLRHAVGVLMALLNAQFSLGIIFLVFGTAYMPIALRIVLPPQYLATSAPSVLGAWVWYLPILAINGGLEAFFSSVATRQDLNMQSRCAPSSCFMFLADDP
jgi:oligosaccharide translocation protein RFT1